MLKRLFLLTIALNMVSTVLADQNQISIDDLPIEVFIIEPINIAYTSFYVPAEKSGPLINRSCQPKRDLSFSSVLPATVRHTKTEKCQDQVARILAENTSLYHTQSLPLTIFNGWQWEYTYSLCQFESVKYELDRRGGSWENCWEAILSASYGKTGPRWLKVYSLDKCEDEGRMQASEIEIITFSSMRTRDGYPKQRKL